MKLQVKANFSGLPVAWITRNGVTVGTTGTTYAVVGDCRDIYTLDVPDGQGGMSVMLDTHSRDVKFPHVRVWVTPREFARVVHAAGGQFIRLCEFADGSLNHERTIRSWEE
jgi:hypothetical protein